MTISDDTLARYVDGELDAAVRAQVEAAIAADPELSGRAQQHRALRGLLSATYDSVLDEPVPDRLRDAAQPADAKVVDSAPRRDAARIRVGWTWAQWGGMAAALLVGILVGRGMPGDDIAAEGGQLVARGRLAQALSTQLASTQPPDAAVKIGLSYLSRTDAYCRSFALVGTQTAGLACRRGDDWALRLLAQDGAAAGSGDLRQAASPVPASVLRAVEEDMQGDPLDAQGERAALQKGWRR
ncbi:anti-sigma factor family protein [Piscinibacter sp.]|uniref:anti-sigma factor family protein n=1 Tax=Piscinibacter sp. TaxID=1903157 RepID=UPI002C5C4CA6|nr:hypothetical protein [Albitalea sp.]HUG24435.1 hypothetical protein [Albitalea sp.]